MAEPDEQPAGLRNLANQTDRKPRRRAHSRPLTALAQRVAPQSDPQTEAATVRDLEDRLRAFEQQERATFEQLPVALLRLDLQGRITRANVAACALLGCDAAALVGRMLAEVALPDAASAPDAPAPRAEMDAGMDEERRFRRGDGVDIWARVTISVVTGEDGAPLHRLALLQETTERRRREQAEQAAAEAQARLRATLDVLPIGVAIVDRDGKPQLVNDAVRAVWGENLIIVEGREQFDTYQAWSVATGERVQSEEWGLARALTHGETTSGVEYDIQTFDGQRKVILDAAAPLRDANGASIGAVSVIVDITERKRLEREAAQQAALLHTTVEAMTDGVTVVDAQGNIVLQNRAARDLIAVYGSDGFGAATPTNRVRVLTPRDAQGRPLDAARYPRARVLRGETLTSADAPELEFDVADGAVVYVSVTGAPLRDASGAITGAVLVSRDVTLRRRMEEALRRSEAEARELADTLTVANRVKDEFLSIASHELRTPLTTVKASIQVAHRRAQRLARELEGATGLDDEAIQALRQSLEQLSHSLERGAISVERQERLVQDLLDVSRITAGKITYRMAPQDLAALVRDATEEQRLIAPQRIIQLELPEQPIAVTADADRITQVVGNYLTNALKYSPSDQPVSVSVRPHGDIAQVIVRDSGPGLTPEQQRRLFEQFYRADGIEVLSGSGVGLGLGLYISKAIVESHGGQVGVESAPGAGSAFWFTLPLADPRALAPATATE